MPPKRRGKWTVFWEGVDAGQGQTEAVSERGHRNPWVVPRLRGTMMLLQRQEVEERLEARGTPRGGVWGTGQSHEHRKKRNSG